MTTVNYDRAVSYYDETRGLRAGVSERYREAVLALTGVSQRARILELAIGTGVIGLPFMAAGHHYTGVDVSLGMMRRIAPKLKGRAAPRLAQADITVTLPFAPASFDLAQAIRVFHMLVDWRACIDAARRVLKPGGCLLIVEHHAPPDSGDPPPWALAQDRWDAILRELGVDSVGRRRHLYPSEAQLLRYLRDAGADTQAIDLMTYVELPVSCRTMVQRRAARMFRSDWALPESIHRQATRRLYDWLEQDCPAADEPAERRMAFRAIAARF
jgi:ubiquinone/menaquinone biosynthesis C-methylase UbiE